MKTKNIIKEIIIVLLLILAIILILGILLYEYVPNNKIIPQQVSYTTPENVKEELSNHSVLPPAVIEPAPSLSVTVTVKVSFGATVFFEGVILKETAFALIDINNIIINIAIIINIVFIKISFFII